MNRIVVDTNIWVGAVSSDDDYDLDCDLAISTFMNRKEMILALDLSGKMEDEYRDEVGKNRKYQMCMLRLNRQNRKCWVDNRLNNKYITGLDKCRFHEAEDREFVGTAMNADKIIVTEDSDYGVHGEEDKKAAYDYLTTKMGLRLMTADGFNNENN